MSEKGKAIQKRLKIATTLVAIPYLFLIPTVVVLIFLLAFGVKQVEAIADLIMAFLNLITVLYMVTVNHFLMTIDGWKRVDERLRWLRVMFWIILLVNMTFLAKYVASFIPSFM